MTKRWLFHVARLAGAICVGVVVAGAAAWLIRSGAVTRIRAPAWVYALPTQDAVLAPWRHAQARIACAQPLWSAGRQGGAVCGGVATDAFPVFRPAGPSSPAMGEPVTDPGLSTGPPAPRNGATGRTLLPGPSARVILRGETSRILDATGAVWSLAPARNGSVRRNDFDLTETMNVAKLEYRDGGIFQTNDKGGVWRWAGPVSAGPGARWQNVVAERPMVAPRPSTSVEGLVLDRRELLLSYEENFDTLAFDVGDSRAPMNGRLQTWLNNDFDPRRNRDNFWSRTLHQDKAEEDQYYVDPYILERHARDLRGAATYNPFSIVDGSLRITARRMPPILVQRLETRIGRARGLSSYESRKGWASGVISTHESFAQRYGVWEARMRLPEVPGMWPAFWMLNEERGWPPEIDIVDNFHSARHPDRVVAGGVTVRGPPQKGFGPFDEGVMGRKFPFPISGVFHTFAVEWGAEEIVYFVDDVAFWRQPTPANFHDPMHLMINLAVVGPDNTWADQPPVTLQSAYMDVDWVRVWRRIEPPSRTRRP